jgi:hypothetical protein
MGSVPHVVIAAGMFAIVLGGPISLYAVLTRKQRAVTREIRRGAREHGWHYSRRRWQGNPTAFRIDGQSGSGQRWVMTSGNSGGYDRGWSVTLNIRFPGSGGPTDFAILPRDSHDQSPMTAVYDFEPEVLEKIARMSGTAAGAIDFLATAIEQATGVKNFDQAYRVSVVPSSDKKPIVDAAFAGRILTWPVDAVAPHSILAWRDIVGMHFRARLPGAPNRATVEYALSLAEELVSRLPPGSPVEAQGAIDKLLVRYFK